MANQAQFVLQVSDYTLAGIDRTNRTIRVQAVMQSPIIVPGDQHGNCCGWWVRLGCGRSLAYALAKAPAQFSRMATVSTGAIATATVVNPGAAATATTADAQQRSIHLWARRNSDHGYQCRLRRPAHCHRRLDHLERRDVQCR